jgi:hypothetical protein
MPPFPRTFTDLLRDLDLPAAERPALKECFQRAIAARERQGRSLGSPLTPDDMLSVPYLLGWLAVEAVRHRALSAGTKHHLVNLTLQQVRPLENGGLPYGLPVLVSFMAAQGALDLTTFTALMKAAEIGHGLFDTLHGDEARALSDWLITQPALDDRQRLWWLWFLTTHCGDHRAGQPWADALVADTRLSPDFRQRLCEAWLSPRPPSAAPAAWRALDEALAAGLRETAPEPGAHDFADDLARPRLPETGADSEAAAEDDEVMVSFNVVGHLMQQALGGYVPVPHYLERRAVLGLAQTGQDPLAVCRRFLAGSLVPFLLGVADTLEAFHAQLPPDEVRALVEQGQALAPVKARQAFYALAARLYGPSAWQRAQQDPAASIRAWAAGEAATG